MIDYTPTLNIALNTILPAEYELILDSNTSTPCITYMKVGDSAQVDGDDVRYSIITYQIKIWSDSYETICQKSVLLDEKMNELGFKRVSYNELWFNNKCSAVFRYEALVYEEE